MTGEGAKRFASLVVLLGAFVGCGRSPTPLWPAQSGSIGAPSKGTLAGGKVMVERRGVLSWLRKDPRHFGLPRFVDAVTRIASDLVRERGGPPIVVGDLSIRSGGMLMPHFSHRNGRDLDILLFFTTLEGAPVDTPDFLRVGADGLAWDPKGKRFLRFDVARQWALVRALVTDAEARVQWVFIHKNLRTLVLAWAEAMSEPVELRARAAEVMLQPQPGGLHDDHVHVRTACAPEDLASGCEATGPSRSWLDDAGVTLATNGAPNDDDELVRALLAPP
jgi:penicillin-insensitive murein endopeptidase